MKDKAYKIGFVCALARILGARGMLADSAKWITIHPNGKGQKADGGAKKGKAVLIEGSTGEILGGLGGKFTGKKINTIHKTKSASSSPANGAPANQNKPATASTKRKIDLSLPKKIDKSTIIQNRNRSTRASIEQINSIASKPDYYRLATSHSLSDGAPVVSYGKYDDSQLGNKALMVASDGTRYQGQYAVVEAGDVATSNDKLGTENKAYYSDDPNLKRAIAGNGRLTGLQEAYNRGTAGKYKAELLEDTSHGVDPEVIKKMKNPVLVRVMQPKDITADIGDKTNTVGVSRMSAQQQAKNDSNRIKDYSAIETYETGEPTKQAIMDFISSMPIAEQGELLTAEGQPTRQAEERLKSALFQKAYQSDRLTSAYSEYQEPDNRNLLKALENSSAKIARLGELPKEYDIRPLITKSVEEVFKARKEGQTIEQAAQNTDLFNSQSENDSQRALISLFAKWKRSPAKLSEKLNAVADNLAKLYEASKADPFGGFGMPTQSEVIRNVVATDAKNRIMTFWGKDGAGFFSDDLKEQRKAEKKFRALQIQLYR